MHTAEERAAAIKARDDLFLEAIRDGLSVKAIAARLGIEEDYAKRERRRLAALHQLTVEDGDTPELPYGFTEASKPMRQALGTHLYKMITHENMHPVEIAFKTGVTQIGQLRARSKEENRTHYNTYDWKLSEIERLAAARGLDFREMMKELLGL